MITFASDDKKKKKKDVFSYEEIVKDPNIQPVDVQEPVSVETAPLAVQEDKKQKKDVFSYEEVVKGFETEDKKQVPPPKVPPPSGKTPPPDRKKKQAPPPKTPPPPKEVDANDYLTKKYGGSDYSTLRNRYESETDEKNKKELEGFVNQYRTKIEEEATKKAPQGIKEGIQGEKRQYNLDTPALTPQQSYYNSEGKRIVPSKISVVDENGTEAVRTENGWQIGDKAYDSSLTAPDGSKLKVEAFDEKGEKAISVADKINATYSIDVTPYKNLRGTDFRKAVSNRSLELAGFSKEESQLATEAIALQFGEGELLKRFSDKKSIDEVYEDETLAKSGDKLFINYTDTDGIGLKFATLARILRSRGFEPNAEGVRTAYVNAEEYFKKKQKETDENLEKELKALGEREGTLSAGLRGIKNFFASFGIGTSSDDKALADSLGLGKEYDLNRMGMTDVGAGTTSVTPSEFGRSLEMLTDLYNAPMRQAKMDVKDKRTQKPHLGWLNLITPVAVANLVGEGVSKLTGQPNYLQGHIESLEKSAVGKYAPSTSAVTEVGAFVGTSILLSSAGVGQVAIPSMAMIMAHEQLKDQSPDKYWKGMALNTGSMLLGQGLSFLPVATQGAISSRAVSVGQITLAIGQQAGQVAINPEAYQSEFGGYDVSKLFKETALNLGGQGFDFVGALPKTGKVTGYNLVVRSEDGGAVVLRNPDTGLLQAYRLGAKEIDTFVKENASTTPIIKDMTKAEVDDFVLTYSPNLRKVMKEFAFGDKTDLTKLNEMKAPYDVKDGQIFSIPPADPKDVVVKRIMELPSQDFENRSYLALQAIKNEEGIVFSLADFKGDKDSALTLKNLLEGGEIQVNDDKSLALTRKGEVQLARYNTAKEAFLKNAEAMSDKYGTEDRSDYSPLEAIKKDNPENKFFDRYSDGEFSVSIRDIASMGEQERIALTSAFVTGRAEFNPELGIVRSRNTKKIEGADAVAPTSTTPKTKTAPKVEEPLDPSQINVNDFEPYSNQSLGSRVVTKSPDGSIDVWEKKDGVYNNGKGRILPSSRLKSHLEDNWQIYKTAKESSTITEPKAPVRAEGLGDAEGLTPEEAKAYREKNGIEDAPTDFKDKKGFIDLTPEKNIFYEMAGQSDIDINDIAKRYNKTPEEISSIYIKELLKHKSMPVDDSVLPDPLLKIVEAVEGRSRKATKPSEKLVSGTDIQNASKKLGISVKEVVEGYDQAKAMSQEASRGFLSRAIGTLDSITSKVKGLFGNSQDHFLSWAKDEPTVAKNELAYISKGKTQVDAKTTIDMSDFSGDKFVQSKYDPTRFYVTGSAMDKIRQANLGFLPKYDIGGMADVKTTATRISENIQKNFPQLSPFAKALEGAMKNEEAFDIVVVDSDRHDYSTVLGNSGHEATHKHLMKMAKGKYLYSDLWEEAKPWNTPQGMEMERLMARSQYKNVVGDRNLMSHEMLAMGSNKGSLKMLGVEDKNIDIYANTYLDILESLNDHYGDTANKVLDFYADPKVKEIIDGYKSTRLATGERGLKGSEDAGTRSSGKASEAENYFSAEALNRAKNQNEKSREKLITMKVDDFLAMAQKLDKVDSQKFTNLQKLASEGTKFESLPYLRIDKDGNVKAHEGRHRVLMLKGRGITEVPVVLVSENIRWGSQAEGSFDKVQMPKQMTGEDGKSKIPFPVKDGAEYPVKKEGLSERQKAITNQKGLEFTNAYAEKAGIKLGEGRIVVNPLSSSLIDEAVSIYESTPHSPQKRDVKEAYDALLKETADQYKVIADSGLKIEKWTGDGEPYKNGSKEMIADIVDNNHYYYLPTDTSFGSGESVSDHPMLQDSGIKNSNGDSMPHNDVFRIVHDIMGHLPNEFQFGIKGETNAFVAHSELYSEQALPALMAETLMQNSVVAKKNYKLEDGKYKLAVEPDKIQFADQKAIIPPKAFVSKVMLEVAGQQGNIAKAGKAQLEEGSGIKTLTLERMTKSGDPLQINGFGGAELFARKNGGMEPVLNFFVKDSGKYTYEPDFKNRPDLKRTEITQTFNLYDTSQDPRKLTDLPKSQFIPKLKELGYDGFYAGHPDIPDWQKMRVSLLNTPENRQKILSPLEAKASHYSPHRFKPEVEVKNEDGTTEYVEKGQENGREIVKEFPLGRFRDPEEVRHTGEGATVYGDGLYFFTNEEVGRYYKNQFDRKVKSQVRPTVLMNGKPLDLNSIPKSVSKIINSFGDSSSPLNKETLKARLKGTLQGEEERLVIYQQILDEADTKFNDYLADDEQRNDSTLNRRATVDKSRSLRPDLESALGFPRDKYTKPIYQAIESNESTYFFRREVEDALFGLEVDDKKDTPLYKRLTELRYWGSSDIGNNLYYDTWQTVERWGQQNVLGTFDTVREAKEAQLSFYKQEHQREINESYQTIQDIKDFDIENVKIDSGHKIVINDKEYDKFDLSPLYTDGNLSNTVATAIGIALHSTDSKKDFVEKINTMKNDYAGNIDYFKRNIDSYDGTFTINGIEITGSNGREVSYIYGKEGNYSDKYGASSDGRYVVKSGDTKEWFDSLNEAVKRRAELGREFYKERYEESIKASEELKDFDPNIVDIKVPKASRYNVELKPQDHEWLLWNKPINEQEFLKKQISDLASQYKKKLKDAEKTAEKLDTEGKDAGWWMEQASHYKRVIQGLTTQRDIKWDALPAGTPDIIKHIAYEATQYGGLKHSIANVKKSVKYVIESAKHHLERIDKDIEHSIKSLYVINENDGKFTLTRRSARDKILAEADSREQIVQSVREIERQKAQENLDEAETQLKDIDGFDWDSVESLDTRTGEQLMKDLWNTIGKAETSKLLLEIGIKGNKFLDNSSGNRSGRVKLVHKPKPEMVDAFMKNFGSNEQIAKYVTDRIAPKDTPRALADIIQDIRDQVSDAREFEQSEVLAKFGYTDKKQFYKDTDALKTEIQYKWTDTGIERMFFDEKPNQQTYNYVVFTGKDVDIEEVAVKSMRGNDPEDPQFDIKQKRLDVSAPLLQKGDFDAWVDLASRLTKDTLTAKEVQKIQDLSDAGDIEGLHKYVADLTKMGVLELFTNIIKVNPLLGAKTLVRNITSNLGFSAMEEASRIPASVVDMAMAVTMGKDRTVQAPSFSYLKGLLKGSTVGVGKGLQTFFTGEGQTQTDNPYYARERTTDNIFFKPFEIYTKYGFRLQEGADKPAKVSAETRAMDEIIALKAKNEGITRSEARANLTAEDVGRALEYAKFATFQNDNAITDKFYAFKENRNELIKAVIDLGVPYIKTPTNVLYRTLDYSGILPVIKAVESEAGKKFITADWKGFKEEAGKAINNPDARRAMSFAVGRGMVGWSLAIAGYYMAQSGLLNSTYDEKDRKDNALSMLRGVTHGSVNYKGSTYDISALNPISFFLLAGADAYKNETDAINTKLSKGEEVDESKERPNIKGFPSNLFSLDLLKKMALMMPLISKGYETIEDYKKDGKLDYSRLVGAGRVVPAGVGELAQHLDPKTKVVGGDGTQFGKMRDDIRQRIPHFQGLQDALGMVPYIGQYLKGDRASLPNKVDMLGRDIPTASGFDPFRSKTTDKDKLTQELDKFNITFGRFDGTPAEQNAQRKEFGQAVGQRLNKVVSTSLYDSMSEDSKKKVLESTIRYFQRDERDIDTELDNTQDEFNYDMIMRRQADVEKILSTIKMEKYSDIKAEDRERYLSKIYATRFFASKRRSIKEATANYNEFIKDPEKWIDDYYKKGKKLSMTREERMKEPRKRARSKRDIMRDNQIKNSPSLAPVSFVQTMPYPVGSREDSYIQLGNSLEGKIYSPIQNKILKQRLATDDDFRQLSNIVKTSDRKQRMEVWDALDEKIKAIKFTADHTDEDIEEAYSVIQALAELQQSLFPQNRKLRSGRVSNNVEDRR